MIEIGILAGILIGAVVLIFTLAMFRDWVKNHLGKYRNRQLLTGLVRDRLESGDYKITRFLFDEDIKEFVEADAIRASSLDQDLEDKFGNKDTIIEPIAH